MNTRQLARAALSIGALLTAAEAPAQGWEAGAKSGVSRATVTRTNEFDWSGALPTSAFFLRRLISGPFAIQGEAAHLRRVGVSTTPGSTLTLTADYVELPLMFQLQLLSLVGIEPFLSAGPSLTVRVRCRLEFVGGGLRTNDDCDIARGVRSRRIDVGGGAGGGLRWRLGAVTLEAEGRATAGARTYVLPTDVRDSRNVAWSALLGASMPLYPRRALPTPGRVFPLAALPVESEIKFVSRAPAAPREPIARAAPAAPGAVVPTITLTAVDADARALILEIARLSRLNVSVSPSVRTRVSVSFTAVPADEAIQAIGDVAGLSVIRSTDVGGGIVVAGGRRSP